MIHAFVYTIITIIGIKYEVIRNADELYPGSNGSRQV